MKKTNEKIAIYGGSFDPVTYGHKELVKNLSEIFDKVIVVPSNVSPFKKNAKAEDGFHRIEMLKLAFDGVEKIEISDFELKQKGTSYSYLTLEHFQKQHENAKFSIVIGSDMVAELDKWENFSFICERATFYVQRRDGFKIATLDRKRLREMGAKLKVSKTTIADHSSTLARVALAFDSNSIVPKKALNHIKENNLYCDYNEYVDFLKSHQLNDEKLRHTFNATKQGIFLAQLNGEDTKSVILAMLLHDVAKNAKSNKFTDVPANIVHSFIGAEFAEKFLFQKGLKDNEVAKITNAIRLHTLASPNMNTFEKIVYLADKTDEDREGVEFERLRKKALKNLDEAIEASLKITVKKLKKEKTEIHPQTLETLEHFKALNAQRRYEKKIQREREKKEKENANRKVEKKPIDGNLIDNSETLSELIFDFLDEKKGQDISVIDVRKKTIICDFFIICSVTSSTAVRALTDYVDERLSKDYKLEPLRRDIDKNWAAIDYGSVIMHIQTTESRAFYDIERLWS
ncbi:MAG: nicotinate (nicotinamide) nucleotide adenylyltransferase [Firmicutes bacterium]|nr:nicotinate (nicotinamide) nucleotide adenylyltransferase [Bacillota bacterium]MCL2256490.1 nicotinate (nicotinamide) nucleotide adenylyltransferase [Bacillota bacterium]